VPESEYDKAGLPPWLFLIFALLLFAANTSAVVHGIIDPPPGYRPMGVMRDGDVAQYLTWIHASAHQARIPNYHAAWRTGPGLFNPIAWAIAVAAGLGRVSPIVAYNLFLFTGYCFNAWAFVFCLKTFCRSRGEAIAAMILAFCCVPLRSLLLLPVQLLSHNRVGMVGSGEFHFSSDGFLRGLNGSIMTFGVGVAVLAAALWVRYLRAGKSAYLCRFLVVIVAGIIFHPFEPIYIVTISILSLVWIRRNEFGRALKIIALIGAVCGLTLLFHVVPVLKHPWLALIAPVNRGFPFTPVQTVSMLGLPAIVALALLLLGFPKRFWNRDPETGFLVLWLLGFFVIVYIPCLPFPLHMLHGAFLAIGILLVHQWREIRPFAERVVPWRGVRILFATLFCGWMIYPQAAYRWQAWRDGASPQPYAFYSTVVSDDEVELIHWFREKGVSEELVLSPAEMAPWIATAPVYSFASHKLFSLLVLRPWDKVLQTDFYAGRLTPAAAADFLERYQIRFIVVPNGSLGEHYVGAAVPRLHLKTMTLVELPQHHLRDFDKIGDPLRFGYDLLAH
jgi:hypothetical protein